MLTFATHALISSIIANCPDSADRSSAMFDAWSTRSEMRCEGTLMPPSLRQYASPMTPASLAGSAAIAVIAQKRST